jgi:predicted 3-demethylubiquinone-9 3-methyltransferase (glyoxalase superfamily)
MSQLTTCLWFDGQAEEAMRFYTSVFKKSKKGVIARYGEAGPGKKGSVMTATWEIEGQRFMGLNAGPEFKFSNAVSFVVPCKKQKQVDYYWDKLLEGGTPQQCGWLTDKFGLSWQITPTILPKLLRDKNAATRERVMKAMMGMVKLDIKALKKAAKGTEKRAAK